MPRIGDFSLNVTNRLAAREVLSRGLAAFTPSFDLDAAQLESLLASPFGPFAEVVVHHPMPLFHMEHCVIGGDAVRGQGSPHLRPPVRPSRAVAAGPGGGGITRARGGRGVSEHGVPRGAPERGAPRAGLARSCGVQRFRIELVREDAEGARRVVEAYRRLLAGEVAPRGGRARAAGRGELRGGGGCCVLPGVTGTAMAST